MRRISPNEILPAGSGALKSETDLECRQKCDPKSSEINEEVNRETDNSGLHSPRSRMQTPCPAGDPATDGSPSSLMVGHGRSVREVDEQIALLRKENFNLKLRLYIIEETTQGFKQSGASGQENLMKHFIDAKMETAKLNMQVQDIQGFLKNAKQKIQKMERIHKDEEAKSQATIDELKQKLFYFEMEPDLGIIQNADCLHDLMGHIKLTDNMDAVEKIRELEAVICKIEKRLSERHQQIEQLKYSLSKRDSTIIEYEEKVKEVVFQNAELVELLENKEQEVDNIKHIMRGLHMENDDLKDDNQHLTEKLKSLQETSNQGTPQIHACEHQIRKQQAVLSEMQMTIADKSASTAQLLERLQKYQKTVEKISAERNLVHRENHFFRALIIKLTRNMSSGRDIAEVAAPVPITYTVEKMRNNSEECDAIRRYHNYHSRDRCTGQQPQCCENTTATVVEQLSGRGDYSREYKVQQKFCVQFNNTATRHYRQFTSNAPHISDVGEVNLHSPERILRNRTAGDSNTEIPIRFSISETTQNDSFNINGGRLSNSNSRTSMCGNISITSLGDMSNPDDRNYIPLDGIRYVFQ